MADLLFAIIRCGNTNKKQLVKTLVYHDVRKAMSFDVASIDFLNCHKTALDSIKFDLNLNKFLSSQNKH